VINDFISVLTTKASSRTWVKDWKIILQEGERRDVSSEAGKNERVGIAQ
jgi:hypothetical protein